MSPVRIQMRRDRMWRADHPDAVIVARPSIWGNPFTIKGAAQAGYSDPRKMAVAAYRDWLAGDPWACGSDTYEAKRQKIIASLHDLRGRDLACWCPLDGSPCHADVLLEIANA